MFQAAAALSLAEKRVSRSKVQLRFASSLSELIASLEKKAADQHKAKQAKLNTPGATRQSTPGASGAMRHGAPGTLRQSAPESGRLSNMPISRTNVTPPAPTQSKPAFDASKSISSILENLRKQTEQSKVATLGTSVRDASRMKEQQSRTISPAQPGVKSLRDSMTHGAEGSSRQNQSITNINDVARDVAKHRGGDKILDELASEELHDNDPEVVEAERRFQQRQEHVQFKQRDYRGSLPPRRISTENLNSTSSYSKGRFESDASFFSRTRQQQKSGPDRRFARSPPSAAATDDTPMLEGDDDDDEPDSPAAYSKFDRRIGVSAQYVSAPRVGKQEVFVEMTVAEMKKRAQEMKERLLQQQGRQNKAAQQVVDVKPKQAGTVVLEVSVPNYPLLLKDVAMRLSMKLSDVKDRLTAMGESINPAKMDETFVEPDVIELLALELGVLPRREKEVVALDARPSLSSDFKGLDGQSIVMKPRAPVVCIMGHVDHGKTTLLDTLRRQNVAKEEAGGITQKISAFSVSLKNGRDVVFLDTPGHAAFGTMRSFGVMATDVVVLVIAMDDGVRPQTIDALETAKKSKCSMIIALNKADKIPVDERAARRSAILNKLMEHELMTEDNGGDVQVIEVAGKTGEGLDALVDSISIQADVMELQAAFEGQAEAVILDANLDKKKGVVANALVRWGELSVGDIIVVGNSYGHLKAMINDKGKSVKHAFPSTVVQLTGLRHLPQTGQELLSVASEEKAKQIAERRQRVIDLKINKEFEIAMARKVAADEALKEAFAATYSKRRREGVSWMLVQQQEREAAKKAPVNMIYLILKADGAGSLDALQQVVSGVQSKIPAELNIEIRTVYSAVGSVTHHDIDMASTIGDAVIFGFNVDMGDSFVRSSAKENDVSVVSEKIIYRLEDELIRRVTQLLPKERTLHKQGGAKVAKVFQMNDKKKTVVAGLQVSSGSLKNSGNQEYLYRVMRAGVPVLDESVDECELKHFKEKVQEVTNGMECGLSFEKFNNFAEGDEIECYRIEWKTKELNIQGMGAR